MFYSHTFLARKGPLATVWIAAHLQHRLRKSHYTSTDIPATVKRIMEPEVPIALRMSGHLLLGVVRIYSKKVDYLFQDCNSVLTDLNKASASIQLTLPEDARQAPVQSITLPDTFDLDALNMDGVDYGVEDIHLRSQEEITLTDQIPVGMDYYVAITFDEDIMMDTAQTEVLPDSGPRPMEEDVVAQSPLTNVVGFQDPDPSNQRESPTAQHTGGFQSLNIQDPEVACNLASQDAGPSNQTDVLNLSPRANSPQVMPEIEVLRDAKNDSNLENSPPLFPDFGDDNTAPNETFVQNMNEKDNIPPMIDDLDVGGLSVPSQQHSGSPTPAASQGAPEAQVFVGHGSPNLVLRSSPPIQQPQRRGRKRKQFFDTSTVLTNKFMKKALNDPADIMRKRKFMPSSALYSWKMNNSRRKEQVFDQPLITGLCKDLLEISQREYICAKPHLVISEEDHMNDGIARTPSSSQTPEEPRAATPPATACGHDMETQDMEIERLRSVAATPPPTIPALDVETEVINIEGDRSSPVRQDDMTPASAQKLRSVSVSPLRTNDVAGTIQTPNLPASPGDHGSQMETPMTFLDSGTFQEKFGLSDTTHFINSAEEELSFLEADNTPASSQGSEGVNSLSVRTRAVARYLKNHSPISPIAEDPAEDLSLNKILEGKTRKLSARMFFETLVLKSYGLIDIQQEEPYGDVSLKLTPALSKAQI